MQSQIGCFYDETKYILQKVNVNFDHIDNFKIGQMGFLVSIYKI